MEKVNQIVAYSRTKKIGKMVGKYTTPVAKDCSSESTKVPFRLQTGVVE